MPVDNEVTTLPSAAKQLLAVAYSREIELVIVDDRSTDGTRDHYSALCVDPPSASPQRRMVMLSFPSMPIPVRTAPVGRPTPMGDAIAKTLDAYRVSPPASPRASRTR